jgi:hypothetical protein
MFIEQWKALSGRIHGLVRQIGMVLMFGLFR